MLHEIRVRNLSRKSAILSRGTDQREYKEWPSSSALSFQPSPHRLAGNRTQHSRQHNSSDFITTSKRDRHSSTSGLRALWKSDLYSTASDTCQDRTSSITSCVQPEPISTDRYQAHRFRPSQKAQSELKYESAPQIPGPGFKFPWDDRQGYEGTNARRDPTKLRRPLYGIDKNSFPYWSAMTANWRAHPRFIAREGEAFRTVAELLDLTLRFVRKDGLLTMWAESTEDYNNPAVLRKLDRAYRALYLWSQLGNNVPDFDVWYEGIFLAMERYRGLPDIPEPKRPPDISQSALRIVEYAWKTQMTSKSSDTQRNRPRESVPRGRQSSLSGQHNKRRERSWSPRDPPREKRQHFDRSPPRTNHPQTHNLPASQHMRYRSPDPPRMSYDQGHRTRNLGRGLDDGILRNARGDGNRVRSPDQVMSVRPVPRTDLGVSEVQQRGFHSEFSQTLDDLVAEHRQLADTSSKFSHGNNTRKQGRGGNLRKHR